jgi:hypothetical protein
VEISTRIGRKIPNRDAMAHKVRFHTISPVNLKNFASPRNQFPLGALSHTGQSLRHPRESRPALFEQQRNAPMTSSEQFLRHAAECELMSKFTPSIENKEVWKRMAARWIRCAELDENQSSAATNAKSAKRHGSSSSHWAH